MNRLSPTTNPSDPMVAVVTPFFNTATFLSGCIESVLAQTYSNWQYLLLDNCSTDGSSAIARDYASRDRRIRLVEATEFVGQRENFNRALRYVPEDAVYVKVVLADDLLAKRCLEDMVHLAERDNEVAIVSSYSKVGNRLHRDGLPMEMEVFAPVDVFRRYCYDDVLPFGSPTSVMCRADLVRKRNPFFGDRVEYFEDVDAWFSLLYEGKLGFVHEVLTFCRMEEGALTPEIKKRRPGNLARFLIISEHAERFLPPDEAKRVVRAHRFQYYADLGEEFLRMRGRSFWKFHRHGLSGIEQRLDWGLLSIHVAFAAIKRILLFPHDLVRFTIQRIINSRGRE